MQLIASCTPSVRIYRSQLHYRDLVLATVVAKASYTAESSMDAVLAQPQLPVDEAEVQTPLGTVESDLVPIKQACDLAVYGPAVSPVPVERMKVSVQIGAFSRAIQVTGERSWTRSSAGIFPSRPIPFQTMPLDYSRAFGGETTHPSGPIVREPNNPGGRGYCLSANDANGKPLPNIEEVDQLITKWEQTPMPAGLLPLPRESVLRGLRGVEADLKAQTTKLTAQAFLFSHPRMQLPAYPAGQEAVVLGMSKAPWRFRLPQLHLAADVSLGGLAHRLRLVPDTLCLVPGQARFWVVSRRAFIYQFIPGRIREVAVSDGGTAVVDSAVTTISNELKSPTPVVPIQSPDAPENMPIPWDMLREYSPLTNILESLPLLASR